MMKGLKILIMCWQSARRKEAKKIKGSKAADKAAKSGDDETCTTSKREGHKSENCYRKGGRKEGQAPWQKKKPAKKETAVVAVANTEKDEMFAFSCTSDYANVAEVLQVSKLNLGSCVNSGASDVYSPEHKKFANYKSIDKDITTADGQKLKAIGMGDLTIDLPNGTCQTMTIFKDIVHAPSMAFTLISISKLDKANFKVLFQNCLHTIIDPNSKTIAKIPHSKGLYKIISQNDSANVASTSGKMSISEAHRKLGHISYGAITHAVSKGLITGIELDINIKPDFCEACVKAKSTTMPFPKESKTRAEKYGDRIYWDL